MDSQIQSTQRSPKGQFETPFSSQQKLQKNQSQQQTSQQQDDLIISELNSKKSSYIKKQQHFPEIETNRSDNDKMQLLLSPRKCAQNELSTYNNNSQISNGMNQIVKKKKSQYGGIMASGFAKKNSNFNIENSECNVISNVTSQFQYHMKRIYEMGKKSRFKQFLLDVVHSQEVSRQKRLTEAQMRTLSDKSIFLKEKRYYNTFGERVYLYNLSKIEERMNLTGNMIYLWQLIKLMCTALALCHFVGTAYYFLAFCESYYLDYTDTWVDVIDFWDKPPHVKYIESYYWALATMTLIGTKGSTVIETTFCICVLTCTIGIFATILSTFSMVYDEMDKKMKSFKQDRDILNSFFELHSLPNDLQGQLQNYLKYSFEGHKEKTASQNFEQLMKKFPAALQDSVKKERYSREIQKFSLLSKNFSVSTIKQLINYIQEEYFMPNQIIVQSGEIQERKLYLILTGEAEILSSSNKVENQISTLKPGDYFGEDTFFTGGPPFYSIRSKDGSFTTVISLSQADFTNIINQNGLEGDKEKYYFIRDQIKNQGYSPILNRKCYLCGGKKHKEQNCNMIFYYPKVMLLIAKYNLSENQERRKYDDDGTLCRASKRKIDTFNTLWQNNIVNARQYIFLEQANVQREVQEILDIQRNYQLLNYDEVDSQNSFLDMDDSMEDSQGIYGQERSRSILEFSSRHQLNNQFQNSASLNVNNNLQKESANYTIKEQNQYDEEDRDTFSQYMQNNGSGMLKRNYTKNLEMSQKGGNQNLSKNLGSIGISGTNTIKQLQKLSSKNINEKQMKNLVDSQSVKKREFLKKNNQNGHKTKLNDEFQTFMQEHHSDGNVKNSTSKCIDSPGLVSQDSILNYSFNDFEEYKQVDAFKLNQFDMFQKNLKQEFKFLNPKEIYQQGYLSDRNTSTSKYITKINQSPTQNSYANQISQNPNFLNFSINDQEKRRKSHLLSNKFQQSQPRFSKRLNKQQNPQISPLYPSGYLQKQKLSLTNNLLRLKQNQRKSNSYQTYSHDPVLSGMFQILLDLQNTQREFMDMYLQGEQVKVDTNQMEKISERLFKTEFFIDTDKMAQFRYYFPSFNYDQVLNKYKQWQLKNVGQKQMTVNSNRTKKFKSKVRNVINAQSFLNKSQRISDNLRANGQSQMMGK
ncbi:Cyclic nucleotide-binding protein [Pseudocohnilembus persalinus]|uniref:Cyclic nucleotide-binding protein n=1 Tax=Pseudocohnilembus persalinus TaxID=266149 RepID=A0A0V0QBT7_PSEPJ|nr:Cyclic nucleotide-binding protein [Pseudocohnilembus persalinus]|eukprot:KRW99724.1 Cyclic nucleotide-binding protein [Pseudocohnilembus persalinus]